MTVQVDEFIKWKISFKEKVYWEQEHRLHEIRQLIFACDKNSIRVFESLAEIVKK